MGGKQRDFGSGRKPRPLQLQKLQKKLRELQAKQEKAELRLQIMQAQQTTEFFDKKADAITKSSINDTVYEFCTLLGDDLCKERFRDAVGEDGNAAAFDDVYNGKARDKKEQPLETEVTTEHLSPVNETSVHAEPDMQIMY